MHRKSMKLLKSMPQDTAFFERYADLTHTLTKVSVITQVFTGICEIGILYALIYPSVHDLVPSYAATISTIAAVFLAAIFICPVSFSPACKPDSSLKLASSKLISAEKSLG